MGTSVSNIITVTTPPLGVPPGSATGLILSNISTNSMVLSWTAPAAGTPPLSFQPQISVGGGAFTNIPPAISTTSVTVTGLIAATTYTFQVLTENGTGTTPSATVSQATLSIAPSAPTGLAVVGTPTQTSINLQWSAPTTGSAPLTYQVSLRTPTGVGSYAPFTPTTTFQTQTISGLVAGSSYDLEVTASNAGGTSPASAALLNVVTATPTAVAPSTPTNLTAGVATSSTIPVSWTASATGTPPVSYVVQWRPH